LFPNGLELALVADWRIGYAILANDLGLTMSDMAYSVGSWSPGWGSAAVGWSKYQKRIVGLSVMYLDLLCIPEKSLLHDPDV
jgi:hypothetical protein